MAGFIAPDKLEQIRSANDIVEVISSYVPLKRAGVSFKANCPFHQERTPSFHVNPSRQTWHCFGCNKGGDVFTFVREFEGLTFPEAVKRLADRAHIVLEFENDPQAREKRQNKDVLLTIHEQITKRWHSALLNEAAGQIARDYLAKRGITSEAVELFRLGYAPDLWDDTVNWAKSARHPLDVVEQAGLVIQKEGTDRYYDRFRGRLIFPICDDQGRVVGFSGRILEGDERAAKYVNSPETPIFRKSAVIFGLDKSKRALLDAKTAIICEGQIDLISCYMAGVKNVVAPQGTALTEEHARILKRYAEEVVLCFDSDNAGQNAAVRSLDALLGVGLAIRVATVPAPHDPDSYIKANGGGAFAGLIDQAPGFFDFYLEQLCRTQDPASERGRNAIVKAYGEALLKTNNAVTIDTYAQVAALRLGVAPDALRREIRKAGRQKRGFRPPVEEAPQADAREPEVPAPPKGEFWFLKVLLLHSDELLPRFVQVIRLEWFAHPDIRAILAKAIELTMSGVWHGPAGLLGEFEDERRRGLITEALAEHREIPDPERQIADALLRARNQHLDQELARMSRSLAAPNLTDEQRLEIIQYRQTVQLAKAAPLESAPPVSPSGMVAPPPPVPVTPSAPATADPDWGVDDDEFPNVEDADGPPPGFIAESEVEDGYTGESFEDAAPAGSSPSYEPDDARRDPAPAEEDPF